MVKKINQALNVALCPMKDLLFFRKDLICEAMESDINNRKNMYDVIIRKISNEYMIRNYDEIKLMLDKYYPFITKKEKLESNDIYNQYIYILKSFSKSLLSHRDGKIVYKYWRNSNDHSFLGPYDELKKVEIFHSISKLISMDLLIVIYLVSNNIGEIEQLNDIYSSINLADMQLDDVLVKGVSENHIHANAAFNFNITWEKLMNNDKFENIIQNFNFSRSANSDFKNNPNKYLFLSMILRYILSLFLKYKGNRFNKFSEFISCKEYLEVFERFFDNLEYNIDEFSYGQLYEVLEKIKKEFIIAEGDREADIIFSIFDDASDIKTYGENIFLFKCLTYINEYNNQDTMFKKYFFQYIRIKNELYHQVIQRKLTSGLDNFQEYFHRGTLFIWKSLKDEKKYYSLMLRTLFQDEYLKKVELRFSMKNSKEEFKKHILIVLTAYKKIIDEYYKIDLECGEEFPKIGIVFHFIKELEKSYEKCWTNYCSNRESTFNEVEFKKLQENYKKQLISLVELRNKTPYLSYFILGIDAASLENNTPVEVFAPIYEVARDSRTDPLINIDKNANIVKNKSLAFTFHAGEDFRHLVSGLRRIDEVIDHCKFHSGDRIGHATALGINADTWSKENPVVIIPRGEYLDNLLWIWGIYAEDHNTNPGISLYLEREIYDVAKSIFQEMNGVNTNMLYESYKMRFQEFKKNNDFVLKNRKCNSEINNEGIFCIKASDTSRIIWSPEKIVHSYSCTCYLKNIKEPIYISVKNLDIQIIKEIQHYLIKKLSKMGIVVEINPSSNALIGEINEMFENQAFAINKIDDLNNNVMINVNTDDPMIFNTNISNEYAYLYYGLLDKGASKEQSLQWIEKLRMCGMETSFIDNKISGRKYYEYLNRVIQALGGEEFI